MRRKTHTICYLRHQRARNQLGRIVLGRRTDRHQRGGARRRKGVLERARECRGENACARCGREVHGALAEADGGVGANRRLLLGLQPIEMRQDLGETKNRQEQMKYHQKRRK